MKYNQLGNTALKISELGFGASAIGGMFDLSKKKESLETVQLAFDRGINYFDTSPAYGRPNSVHGPATSEIFLGQALENISRVDYILSTKAGKRHHCPLS